MLKVKIRRVVYNKTLALHSVSLNSLGLVNDRGEETCGERWVRSGREGGMNECATPLYRVVKFSNAEVDVDVKLCYTPLPSFSVNALNGFPPVSKDAGETPSLMWVWLSCDLVYVGVAVMCSVRCAECACAQRTRLDRV